MSRSPSATSESEPMWGVSYEADFTAGTWTFKMVGHDWEVSAGSYAIIYNDEYQDLLKGEKVNAAQSSAPGVVPPVAAPSEKERTPTQIGREIADKLGGVSAEERTDDADADYIIAKLEQRVLPQHGGKGDPAHWTNLTEGDSAMHAEAARLLRASPQPKTPSSGASPAAAEKMPRTFEYLLNAMEAAAQEKNPAEHGYGEKRKRVLQYVADLFSDYMRRHNDACNLELSVRSSERVKVCPRCGDAAKCSAPGCPLAAPAATSSEAVASATHDLRQAAGQDGLTAAGCDRIADMLSAAPAAVLTNERPHMKVTDEMVDRFLSWPLPASVCSDPCVTRSDYQHQRVGTNLLTADEARQMLEHVLSAASASGGRRQPCRAPSATMTMSLRADEWYCHGCGANQAEPECRYLKSAPDSPVRDA